MTDYSRIDRPFDNLLSRDGSSQSNPTVASSTSGGTDSVESFVGGGSAGGGQSNASGGSVATVAVKNDNALDDLWIKNTIRSVNWKPKTYGFFMDGATGYAEFANVYVSGTIEADSGSIGGSIIEATFMSSDPFVSGPLGVGWKLEKTGEAEFQNVTIRGVIKSAVFEKDTISAVNGLVMISKSDVLAADMTALDASTITITGETTFVNNEVIRIKDGVSDEWMLVTDASGAPTYVVTRDLAATYAADTNPAWTKGTAIVSMGVGTGTKTGFMLMDSSSSNSPYFDIYSRNSNTYSDYSLKARLGWLKGITDSAVGLAGTDVWGLYSDSVYLSGTINANSGRIGNANNYWNITATGIEAVSTTSDVKISYGKTDFGDSVNPGFILGYDFSASKAKFLIGTATEYFEFDGTNLTVEGGDISGSTITGVDITGSTITGGTIRTSASGSRVEMDSGSDSFKVYSGSIKRMELDADELRFYDSGGSLASTLHANGQALDIDVDDYGWFSVNFDNDGSASGLQVFETGGADTIFFAGGLLGSNIVQVGGDSVVNFTVRGDILTYTDERYEIGSSSSKWQDGHFLDLHVYDDLLFPSGGGGYIFYPQRIYWYPQSSNPSGDGTMVYYDNGSTEGLRMQFGGSDFQFSASAV